jgi:hypothetical protein
VALAALLAEQTTTMAVLVALLRAFLVGAVLVELAAPKTALLG